MAEITLTHDGATAAVTALSLLCPRVGQWTADVTLDADAGPSGACSLSLDGRVYTGHVVRGAVYAGAWRGRIVGSAGLLADAPATALQGATLALVLRDLAGAVGITLAADTGPWTPRRPGGTDTPARHRRPSPTSPAPQGTPGASAPTARSGSGLTPGLPSPRRRPSTSSTSCPRPEGSPSRATPSTSPRAPRWPCAGATPCGSGASSIGPRLTTCRRWWWPSGRAARCSPRSIGCSGASPAAWTTRPSGPPAWWRSAETAPSTSCPIARASRPARACRTAPCGGCPWMCPPAPGCCSGTRAATHRSPTRSRGSSGRRRRCGSTGAARGPRAKATRCR
jgi:hypothetical protein